MALRVSPIFALIVALLLSHVLYTTFAASAGRMGGSSFKSSKSPSLSSRSRHYYHHSTTLYRYNNYHTQQRSTTPSPPKMNYKEGDFSIWPGVCLATFLVVGFSLMVYLNRGVVLKVQVGLSGRALSLQRDLNAIAKITNTKSSKGWHHILTETTLALLRHPFYFISGYSSVDKMWSIEGLEKRFKQLSREEREKFDIESLVNVNNNKLQREVIPNTKVSKDCIVVTILVAANGAYKLPAIRSTEDLNEALQYLSTISYHKIKGVEVLWTPQDENDSLSADELLENYPLLRPI